MTDGLVFLAADVVRPVDDQAPGARSSSVAMHHAYFSCSSATTYFTVDGVI